MPLPNYPKGICYARNMDSMQMYKLNKVFVVELSFPIALTKFNFRISQ